MDLGTVEAILTPRERAAVPPMGPSDAYLAGGTWVFSEPQTHLRRLVDLTTLGWPALVSSDDGLEIAATCTLAELAAAPVPPSWPALALGRACCDALRGSFKVWNAATVGGNLCLALAAAPMVAFGAGLDAVCTIWTTDGGARTCTVPELVTGPNRTSLAPGEILRSLWIPAAALGSATAVRQASLTPLGRSAALLVGRIDEPAGEFVLTITASTPHPVQLRLPIDVGREALAAALAERLAPGDFYDDVHGDPAWRQHLTGLLAEEIRAELAAGAA